MTELRIKLLEIQHVNEYKRLGGKYTICKKINILFMKPSDYHELPFINFNI